MEGLGDIQTAQRRIEECQARWFRLGEPTDALDLSRLGLRAVPPDLFGLKHLKTLKLAGNRLRALPAELGQLTALTELDLANNELTSVPAELGRLTLLRELRLDNNRLSKLAAELGGLSALTHLWLDNNRLTEVPAELGQMNALRELHLNNNKLAAVPAEFGQLTGLKRLYLQKNHLSALPPELGQLRGLELLNAEDNDLTALPFSLRQLTLLGELTLHGNQALGLPVELLGPRWIDSRGDKPPANPQAILDFYFARQVEGAESMREVRVLLIGRGRVGKTSLLKVLRGGKLDAAERETPGITVLPLPLRCARGQATGHAWDFGGQEFLHGTHQIFLSERCVYLLVLEGRESNWESETDYWLRFIQSFGGESPVVVALNKYDAHRFTVDEFRLQERCPQIVGFVPTDALTGLGIAELRMMLEESVNAMPEVWLGVAKSWHRVKEKLGKMTTSFLDYKEYQALCVEEKVADDNQQASLAETLHRLGIALNFRKHHRLRETSVLKPQWVTEGIYGLLRFAQDRDCQGVLERAWLAEALPPERYPPEKHAFVMELMEKFEVAFALEEKEVAKQTERWLIPELLPENQPQPFTRFRTAGVKRLRFTYPEALPPGLLPRFIVRTHEMSAGKPRWRSGVVLAWGEARALVRLDRTQRQVTVEVYGPSQEEAQGLFDTIRAHLTVLHGKVPVVEEVQVSEAPVKWVPMTDLRVAESAQDESLKVTIGVGAQAQQVALPVVETLNEVESPEARAAEGPKPPRRMRLFVSYAHADARRIKPLSTHLTILGRRGYIQAWDDRQLIAGQEWEEKIMEELKAADVVLLIYSSESRKSEFMQEKEIPFALARAKAKEKPCIVIPVPLDRKDWDESVALERELKKRQAGTWEARPVLDHKPAAKGWLAVEHEVRKAVEAWRKEGR